MAQYIVYNTYNIPVDFAFFKFGRMKLKVFLIIISAPMKFAPNLM